MPFLVSENLWINRPKKFAIMDSDDDYLYDATDSGNESPDEDGDGDSDNEGDDFGMDIGLGEEPGPSSQNRIEDEVISRRAPESHLKNQI